MVKLLIVLPNMTKQHVWKLNAVSCDKRVNYSAHIRLICPKHVKYLSTNYVMFVTYYSPICFLLVPYLQSRDNQSDHKLSNFRVFDPYSIISHQNLYMIVCRAGRWCGKNEKISWVRSNRYGTACSNIGMQIICLCKRN